MNTKHFPLNLQSNAALSKLRNFSGGGGGLNTPTPPRYATACSHVADDCTLLLSFDRINPFYFEC